MRWQEQLRAKRAETERWIRQREAELKRTAAQAEARGRQAYADTIKSGQQVLARTPAEVRALGVAALKGRLPQAIGEMAAKEVARKASAKRAAAVAKKEVRPTTTAQPGSRQQPPPPQKSLDQQVRAGVSGAVDEFSFGLADRGLAAVEALGEGGLSKFGTRYDKKLTVKRAEDAYDAEHYGTERTTGKAIGFGLGLAATGPAGAVAKAGLRLVPAGAKLVAHATKAPRLKVIDAKGLTRLSLAGGAAAGAGGQAVTDVLSGRRSSLGDYAGAALGGGVGGLAALRRGAVSGGAVGGALTSAAQDVLNGRTPSAENAIEAAHVGGLTAGVLDGLGTYGSAALPNHLKGNLGEGMSALKSVARGRIPLFNEVAPLKNGRHSRPDQTMTHRLLFWGKLDEPEFLEAKLGPSADLSGPQRRLRAENPGRFAVDAWKFQDVGRAASATAAPAGAQLTDEERFPWRVR